jgi:transcriptional regulator with XRE-family HTH domain
MLAQDTTFGFGVPGSNTTIEISAEGLREILGQVEAELYRSEVYRRALSNLQKMPVKGAESAQFLMKAIGREAIRLTLRHFVQTRETSDHGLRGVDDRELDEFPVAAFSRALGSRLATLPLPTVEVVETAPEPEVTPTFSKAIPAIAQKVTPKRLGKKQSLADLAEQAAQERQAGLQQIGEQIRAAREARSMSLSQLHNKTMVPMHQLLALESGQGVHLPEDVYLRGFIKRIGTALDLDNATLLSSLPTPDPTQAILPSWYHPQTKSSGLKGLAVQPLHLYVGYAALMAGGLVWLSHQSTPEAVPGAIQLDAPNVTTSPQSNQPHSMNPGSNIAPPERF